MIRLAPAVAFIPAAAACSYALGHGPPSRQAPGRSSVAAIDALDLSKSKVQLSFWHTQTGANQDKLNAIIDTFNASQPSIRVSPEFQGNYDDIYKKLVAAVAAQASTRCRGFVPEHGVRISGGRCGAPTRCLRRQLEVRSWPI
jgi:sn-glycerol 3-phosphate transport system substrate-binding protein